MTASDNDHASDATGDQLAEFADRVLSIARKITAGEPDLDVGVVPLSPLESLVLRHIHRSESVGTSRLAAELHLQRSNASTVVRALEAKGLITRQPDPADGRAVRLVVTDLARRSIQRIRAHWAAQLREVLPEGVDLAVVVHVLSALDDELDATGRSTSEAPQPGQLRATDQ